MQSPFLETALTVGDEYLASDIDHYDATQATHVELTISYGIGLNKILLLWAFQLDRYRRRHSPSVVFNLITYVWVFFASLLALSLLNVALLKLNPAQFIVAGRWSFVSVLDYTLSSFALGNGGGLQPVGQLGYALHIGAGLTGALVLATLLINVGLTIVRERDDTATQELIDELRDEARQQEQRFKDRYAVTVDEAFRLLQEIGPSTASMVSFLVRAIPTDDASEPRRR